MLVWSLVAALALSTRPAPEARQSFDIAAPRAPSIVRVEGRTQTIFEVHLTNFSAEPLVLTAARFTDADSGRRLGAFAGSDLAGRLRPIGAAGEGGFLAPGARAVLFVELDLGPGPAPRALGWQFDYQAAGRPDIFVVSGEPMAVAADPPVVLGPPLRGGPWVAIHHPDWPRGHRRVFYAVDGRARLPGRFAIDWVRVDAAGKTARGDPDAVSAALGYGAEVLAVADATVEAARDDVAESPKVSANPKHPLGDAAGNFVVLRLAPDRYAIYEHLRPGSLRVKAGDTVRRGAVIAALGFTGDSTGPHLHLHVADRPSPLGGEGAPYAFDAFTLLGRYDDIAALGTRPWTTPAPGLAADRRDEWPDVNVVVRFTP